MISMTNSGLENMFLGLPPSVIPEQVMCDCEHCNELIDSRSSIRTAHRINGQMQYYFYKDGDHLRNYTAD